MSDFKPVITTSQYLSNVPKVDGQFVAVYDTLDLYIDRQINQNTIQRIKYSDVIADTYSNIIGLYAPLANKIYFATDTHQLLQATYSGSSVTWTELGGGSGGGSSTLSGLTDVTISSPTSGQALVYNGSGWVNGSTAGSGGTKVVTENGKTSLQAVTNLSPNYTGTTRGDGAVDLQQGRRRDIQVAGGDYSVAMGYTNRAGGTCSVAIGYDNNSNSYASVAMGADNTARGDYSAAIGMFNNISGYSSVAMGGYNTAIGNYSVAMGGYNTAIGNYSVAMGTGNTTNGYSSVVMGADNTANGDYSVATGYHNNCGIDGAVTNNNSDNFALQYNASGHTGFKGFNTSNTIVDLFNLSNTDVLIARIDVINFDKIASYFIVVSDSSIQSCTLTANVHNNAYTTDIFMHNGVLKLRTSGSISQVGVFYTLCSNTAGGFSSSSSSSSY